MAKTNPNPPHITEQDKQRFWSKVQKDMGDGCWLWTGVLGLDGYGTFQIARPKRRIRASRLAWLITHNEWPALNVLHRCDVPACVRPDHLWLGTDAENTVDRERKGRGAKGSRQGASKLTEADVESIRTQYQQTNITQRQLARQFGVEQPTIYKLLKRINWRTA